MIRIEEYSVDEVFDAMDSQRGKRAFLPDGREFKRTSQRMQMFRQCGVDCVTCGIQGNVFILETHRADVTPHLNLYAVMGNEMVLMTKDHIFPRSMGGANTLDNYQTMCQPCNGAKSNTIFEGAEILGALR